MTITEFSSLSVKLGRLTLQELVNAYVVLWTDLISKLAVPILTPTNWLPRLTTEPPFISPPPVLVIGLNALWEAITTFTQTLAGIPLSVWGKFAISQLSLTKDLRSKVVRLDRAIVGVLEFIIDEGRQATTTNLPGAFNAGVAVEQAVSRWGKWRAALSLQWRRLLPSSFKIFNLLLTFLQAHLRIGGQVLLFVLFYRLAQSLSSPLLRKRWMTLALPQDSRLTSVPRSKHRHRVNLRSGPDR